MAAFAFFAPDAVSVGEKTKVFVSDCAPRLRHPMNGCCSSTYCAFGARSIEFPATSSFS